MTEWSFAHPYLVTFLALCALQVIYVLGNKALNRRK